MNQLAEQTVVERATGGKGGGGAQLTHYGQRLISSMTCWAGAAKSFRRVAAGRSAARQPAGGHLALLAANQRAQSVLRHRHRTRSSAGAAAPAILLNDGTTRLMAAVTQQSADRLQLTPGKEVLALIKAPQVRLSVDTAEHTGADNALAGVVAGIQPGAEHSEVLVTLAGGETLCATLTTAELQRLQLSVGATVHAQFNADRVIVATLC